MMTMYTERHQVMFPAGLHNDPVFSMIRLGLGNHGLTIDGRPVSQENFDHLTTAYTDPKMEVELSAHNGNPQLEKDVVHIAKHIMQQGRSPWPNAPGAIPPERVNQAANAIRAKEGTLPPPITAASNPEPEEEKDDKWEHIDPPEDGDDEWYPEWEGPEEEEKKEASFSTPSSGVKNEMNVEAKWRIVSLGEMQQPGGVGATQESYDPVVDGPNPDGPNFMDNAGNSPEQEGALETWVNIAVDMLNRGSLEDEIIAQLAHDGCPDPQAVLQRAMQQNFEQPVSNEAGTDAFDMPVQQEQTGANDSVTMPQQDVYASRSGAVESDRVLIKRTGQKGKVVASFLDVWGDGVLTVRLDTGSLVDVDPKHVVAVTEVEAPEDPLAEIQKFLDSVDEPLDTRAAVEARLSTLEKASLALQEARYAKSSSYSAQIRADKLKMEVDWEISAMKISRTKMQESDFEYLDALPKFKVNAFDLGDGERPIDSSFSSRVAEDAAILVSELPDEMVADAPGVELRAFHHASAHYASDADTDVFLAEVERRRVARVGTFTRTASRDVDEFTPNEGPAEDLFR